MTQVFIFNNTPHLVAVTILGPTTQAQFIMSPNTIAPLQMSPGLKSLVAFANGALYAMRPVSASAASQVFSVDPNPTAPAGPQVLVYSSPEPDQPNITGIPVGAPVAEQPLIQPFNP